MADLVNQVHIEIQSLVIQIHGRVQNMNRKMNALMERENGAKSVKETKAVRAEITSVKEEKGKAEQILDELKVLLQQQPDKVENNLGVRIMIEYVKQWLMSESMMEFGEPCERNHEQLEKDDCETKRQVDLVTGSSSNDDLERKASTEYEDMLSNLQWLGEEIHQRKKHIGEMLRMLSSWNEAKGITSDAKGKEQDLSCSTGIMGGKDDEIQEQYWRFELD